MSKLKENPKEAFGIIAEIYGVTPDEVQAFAMIDKILNRGIRFTLADSIFGAKSIADQLVEPQYFVLTRLYVTSGEG